MLIKIPGGSRRTGFTLIELLMVITVISILALIVIPRVLSVTRKARESRMAANLLQMRKAVAQYESDCGEYPAVLIDVVAPTSGDLSGGVTTEAKNTYKGPYMPVGEGVQITGYPGIPSNPFVSATDADISHHWIYDATAGTIHSATAGTTLGGVPYSQL